MLIKTMMAAAVGLTAVVATPAFAQDRTDRPYAGPQYDPDAYAQDPAAGRNPSGCRFTHSAHPNWDVCDPGAAAINGNGYIGTDPDPQVRQELQDDPSESE